MAKKGNQITSSVVPTYEERRQKFIKLGWWVSIPLSIVPSHWLSDGEQRLDGGYYAQDVIASNRFIHDCGYEIKPLKDIVSDIFILGRFKRIYASNSKNGWPYLSPSDSFDFRPESEKFIAPDHAPQEAKKHFAKEGWILISASGSVGRVLYTTKRLEKFFLSHDLIRVMPKSEFPIGYVYAFLSTWIGQALIVKDQYGSAIKHLEPHHVAEIPVPILSLESQLTIHNQIKDAYELREKANSLLDEATELLFSKLDLRPYPNSDVPYLPSLPENKSNTHKIPHPQAFTINSNTLNNRFDASYHAPTVRLAIDMISKLTHPFAPLGSLVKDIYLPNRFKRIYVQKEYGIPFLQGSHLPQNILYDLKYVSSKANEKNIQQCVIHTGDILVSRSGTIGVTSLVSQFRDGWVGTEDLLRIIPAEAMANRGYIALFLMTKYGQYQIKSKTYGGVVDHITVEDLKEVIIPNPPLEIQNEIGKLVIEAFELKDLATKMEMETVYGLENLLTPKPINSYPNVSR
jgi:type I restriction enzyme S subunit